MKPTYEKKLFWLLLAILIFLLASIHRNWIFSLNPLVSGDWPYVYPAHIKEWFPFHPLWINYDSPGRGISQPNFIYLFTLYGWMAKLGADFEIISRMLFFIPVLILAPIGAYLAVKEVVSNKIAGIVGAFVYSLNTYFIVIQAGHMHLCVTYALAPFTYYFAVKEDKKSYFWLFFILGIISVYDIRMALVIGMVAIVLSFIYKVKNIQDFWKCAGLVSIGGVCLMLFSMYWILPLHFTMGGPFERNVFDQKALNWIDSLDSFSLHHPFWSGDGVTDFVFQPAPFYMFALPLLAFMVFIIRGKRNDNKLPLYAVICLISLILLMQSNSVVGKFYQVLYAAVPLMSSFRESSKLFFVTSFCYAVLIGSLISHLLKMKNFKLTGLALFLMVLALALPLKVYLGGHFVKAYAQEPVSADIASINKALTEVGQSPSRTLWVSRTPKFAYTSTSAPSFDAAEYGQRFWNTYNNDFSGQGLNYLKQPYTQALLNFGGIGYVVVPKDGIDKNYQHFAFKDANYYASLIQPLKLASIKAPPGSYIWENTKVKPYMYFPNDVISVKSLSEYSGIDEEKTAAYLFEDQNTKNSDAVSKIATNFEANPYTSKYITVDKGIVLSKYSVPEENNLKLFSWDFKSDTFTNSNLVDSTAQLTINSPAVTGENLYPNGSFEEKNLPKLGDCNNKNNVAPIKSGIRSEVVKDSTSGAKGLKIYADRGVACIFQRITDFDKNSQYLVTLDYKYIMGGAPIIATFPYVDTPEKREVTLSKKKAGEWRSYSAIIDASQLENKMYVNLYFPTVPGTSTQTIIDNFKVQKLPLKPAAYIKSGNPKLQKVEIIDKKNTPTSHVLDIKGLNKPRLFIFSETYDPNWTFSIASTMNTNSIRYKLDASTHLIANGLSNSWYIDPASLPDKIKNDSGSYTIYMDYAPQHWFFVGATISTLTVLGSITYLIIIKVTYKQKPIFSIRKTEAKN